jgi:hypothetical protein
VREEGFRGCAKRAVNTRLRSQQGQTQERGRMDSKNKRLFKAYLQN